MVIVLSFVVQPVNCGSFLSFQPWRVVKYSSIDFESHTFNYEQFVELSNSNPDRTLDKVYLYITTHATDEALYEGVDPYCMTFCFWTYDGVKEIQIDSIEILNPDLNGQSADYFEGKTSSTYGSLKLNDDIEIGFRWICMALQKISIRIVAHTV